MSDLLIIDQHPTATATATATGREGLPRLPLEVLEQVVWAAAPGAVQGDPSWQAFLVRLSRVSRLFRHWAHQVLFRILVLPRHVRDFRKSYSRWKTSFPFAGYTRALFCALDDVSRLTMTSAGWESELLRLLHYCGPTLTHLSLWASESLVVLRDPGQVRRTAARYGKRGQLRDTADDDDHDHHHQHDDQQRERAPDQAEVEVEAPAPAPQEGGGMYTKSELDDMPNWLRLELAASGAAAVSARHRAHLVPTRPTSERVYGCRPTHLSIVLSFPLYENEDPVLFRLMRIFSRVHELDVFVTVPTTAQKSLILLSRLDASPLRRLRITTAHASISLASPDPETNVASALAACLNNPHLKQALVNELVGKPYTPIDNLQSRLIHAAQQQAPSHPSRPLQIKITQGNQAVWGKLRPRLSDFLDRAQGHGQGAWEQLL